MKEILSDLYSFLVMAFTLLFSWLLFWSYSSDIFFSFLAAIIAAFMIWLAYVGARLIYLSLL